jgi:hypothetical protein
MIHLFIQRLLLIIFQVKWTQDQMSVSDLGVVWEEKDQVIVSTLELVDISTFQTDSTLKLFVGKSFFAILLKLKISDDRTSVSVVRKEFKNLGSSNIVGIQKIDKNETKFFVLFKEGPPRVFDLREEKFKVENYEFSGCPALDFRNQSCHGLVCSKNGFLWTLVQNGSLDNSRPKGKVSFTAIEYLKIGVKQNI